MEAFKAMIVILLAAAVEFTAVVIYNNTTEPAYEAKIIEANMASTAEVMKQFGIGKISEVPGAAALQKNKSSNF
jgi:hypothetical protein